MTDRPASTDLELVADQITQTIFNAPFTEASRRQQDEALTCAQKILTALNNASRIDERSEVAA